MDSVCKCMELCECLYVGKALPHQIADGTEAGGAIDAPSRTVVHVIAGLSVLKLKQREQVLRRCSVQSLCEHF